MPNDTRTALTIRGIGFYGVANPNLEYLLQTFVVKYRGGQERVEATVTISARISVSGIGCWNCECRHVRF